FRIYENTNGFTALGIQSGTGNVGIGTTTGVAKLTVIATSSASALSVLGTTTIEGVFEVRPSTSTILSFPNSGNLFNISVAANSSGGRPQYQMERMRGTQNTPLAVQTNDYLGSLGFRGFD